ncbi:MAG: hypothetical protein O6761_07790 [Thaumarchaeota archaeon]|nr:hypothetical protein [Nitrososphaerota archaeon]
MVTEPDTKLIKKRIVEIIKDKMFDKTGENGGFLTIQKGLPDNNHFLSIEKPACFVANASDYENDKPLGPVTDVKGITHEGASRHDFNFQIQIFEQGTDAEEVDDLLDDLHRKLKQTLKENFRLVDPKTGENPLVLQSLFTKTGNYSAEQDGKVVDGRIFLFTCLVISS